MTSQPRRSTIARWRIARGGHTLARDYATRAEALDIALRLRRTDVPLRLLAFNESSKIVETFDVR